MQKLVAISRVKNEIDIIEPFVRHHAAHFDKIIILDDGSIDGTYELMQGLRAELSALVVIREPSIGYRQSHYMTRLMHLAANRFCADWIAPIDADEFIEPANGALLREVLSRLDPLPVSIAWHNFVWDPGDDAIAELNPVMRLRRRMAPRLDLPKVIVPAAAAAPGAVLGQGNHWLERDGASLKTHFVSDIHLCHFPIRSLEQFASKVAVGYLQYAADPLARENYGAHYRPLFDLMLKGLDVFAAALPQASRRYSAADRVIDESDPVLDPLDYRGGMLTRTPRRGSHLRDVLLQARATAHSLRDTLRRVEAGRGEADATSRDTTRMEGSLTEFLPTR